MSLLALRAAISVTSLVAASLVGGPAPATAPVAVPEKPGTVPILMYHRTGPHEQYMVRSKENFVRDLNRLYASGFRPVTLAQYAKGEMPLGPGESPVVLTFDDSHLSQFRILPDGSTDPDCFVGIWEEFARRRPDFPVRATFFVNGNGPFEQPAHAKEKVRRLLEHGSEIAWHTMTHPNLARVGPERAKREIASGFAYLAKFGVVPETFALPYGVLPKDRSILEGFRWEGKEVKFRAVVLAGSEPVRAPASRANLLRLHRIQAYGGILGIDYWLNRYRDGREKAYVAGGVAGG